MPDVLIVGAGGHGRETLEILLRGRETGQGVSPIGFVDDLQSKQETIDGFPILGDLSWLENVNRDEVEIICAVGNPNLLRKLVLRVQGLGFTFAQAISGLARISHEAGVGRGVILFPNVVVNTGANIGDHVTLNVGVSVSHDSIVGAYTNLNPGARLAGNVTVGTGCFIGMGANVVQGISIGAWSTVGAGACVIDDLPEGVTAVGVPARIINEVVRQEDQRQ